MSVNWDSMILTDDRGLTVDFYPRLLQKYTNIGVTLSGGTDSVFAFYWLAKCIHDNDLTEHTILPITSIELMLKYRPTLEIAAIIDYVKAQFPKANILDHYTHAFYQTHPDKNFHIKPHKDKLLESGMIDHYINGACGRPLFEDVYLDGISLNRSQEQLQEAVDKMRGPWQTVDKKFVAHQYEKYGLMESIFPLTRSCVAPGRRGRPCKKCGWCHEKYWAFEMFDMGIDAPKPDWLPWPDDLPKPTPQE